MANEAPLGPAEISTIIQAQIIAGPNNPGRVQIALQGVYRGVAGIIDPKENGYTERHTWSGRWVLGCSCGGQEGCPHNKSPLIGK